MRKPGEYSRGTAADYPFVRREEFKEMRAGTCAARSTSNSGRYEDIASGGHVDLRTAE
jgi:hypothetical protein